MLKETQYLEARSYCQAPGENFNKSSGTNVYFPQSWQQIASVLQKNTLSYSLGSCPQCASTILLVGQGELIMLGSKLAHIVDWAFV